MQSVNELSEYITKCASKVRRLVVLIYGGPGSGKSSVAEELVNKLNKLYPRHVTELSQGSVAVFKDIQGKCGEANAIKEYKAQAKVKGPFAVHLQMDGFHLPLSSLTPEQIRRRGSPGTFDGEQAVCLTKLLLMEDWDLISIPDFDHKIKDPINPGSWIFKDTNVIVLEGLYLMLDENPWNQISDIIKQTPLNIDVKVIKVYGGEEETISHRIAKRHYDCGLVTTIEKGLEKYYANDHLNAKLITETSNEDLVEFVVDNSATKKML